MATISVKFSDLANIFFDRNRDSTIFLEFLLTKYSIREEKHGDFKNMIVRSFISKVLPKFKSFKKSPHLFLEANRDWLESNAVYIHQDYLDDSHESSMNSSNNNRLSLSYEEASDRTKRRRKREVLDHTGLQQIEDAYLTGLRSNGKHTEALIIDALRTSSTAFVKEVWSYMKNTRSEDITSSSYSAREALAAALDGRLSKGQYNMQRYHAKAKNVELFPHYSTLQEATKECYPVIDEERDVTDISAEIKLQPLLDHTSTRLLESLDKDVLDGSATYELICKWGCDGSSGQTTYKQILQVGENHEDDITDANCFMMSLVPLRLVVEGDPKRSFGRIHDLRQPGIVAH